MAPKKPTQAHPGPISQHHRMAMGKPIPKAQRPKGLDNV